MNNVINIALSPLSLAGIIIGCSIFGVMFGMFIYGVIWKWCGEKLRRKVK